VTDVAMPSIEQRLAGAGLPPLPRTAWLEIDLDALRGNVRAVRTLVGQAVEVAPVVKADAYGHGLEGALLALADEVATVCVATLDEGLAVRALAPGLGVLVLYPIPLDGVGEAAAARLELVASDEDDTARLLAACRQLPASSRAPRLHLEVETGLQRGGVAPERAVDVARAVDTGGLELRGIWSHLACPDDARASASQVGRFETATAALRTARIPVARRHLAASGGLFAGTAPAYELVRPGLCIYGELSDEVARLAGPGRTALLRPAMTLKARPVRVAEIPAGTSVGYGGHWVAERPSVIATLPLGYGDGWSRSSSPGSRAVVRGRSVPLVGTVAMDAVIADVTDVPGIGWDDEFILLGGAGEQWIPAAAVAQHRNTISWEVVTAMAQRLPRVYHAGPAVVALRTSGVQTVHRSRGGAS
jgi:alanine racemase